VLAAVAAWVSAGHPSAATVLRETGDLLAWRHGPLSFESHTAFDHRFAWVPLSVHMVQIATLLTVAYVIFRPLAAPRRLPDYATRQRAETLVREHGSDTLSYFKLRADKHYFFSDDQRAFVGYRIENGVLLLSGDPVGPRDAFAPLLAQVIDFAERRGLKLGAVGASEGICPLYERMGLRTLYLGDEAIVDLAKFSLQGRPIRKVRQSVTRLHKAGFKAELHDLETLDPGTVAAIENVIEVGRQGAPERGFSMAMDSINGNAARHTMVLIARDGDATIRGVLHFVPCYGREAVSLSFMRRDPDTPNGLTEFMVAQAAELLRDRGLDEMSLNFAAFAKWMHSPSGWLERTLGRLVALGNPFFQIESLYRFNAKFFPRWEPRYLVYEGTLGLARAGIAAMWAEGQLPKPSLPSWGLPDHRAA
jgi:lysyl-tRNA synthetase class 2